MSLKITILIIQKVMFFTEIKKYVQSLRLGLAMGGKWPSISEASGHLLVVFKSSIFIVSSTSFAVKS